MREMQPRRRVHAHVATKMSASEPILGQKRTSCALKHAMSARRGWGARPRAATTIAGGGRERNVRLREKKPSVHVRQRSRAPTLGPASQHCWHFSLLSTTGDERSSRPPLSIHAGNGGAATHRLKDAVEPALR